MKNIIGGLIAIILGIFCLALFFPAFLNFIAGIIPLSLIIGGGAVLYLKHEETAPDTWHKSEMKESACSAAPCQASPVETELAAAEPAATEPAATEPAETETVETESLEKSSETDFQFFGNTDSLVFHRSDCRYSTNKRCTAGFNTRENAIQDGYKPCGACKP
jgi:hypothetical protein